MQDNNRRSPQISINSPKINSLNNEELSSFQRKEKLKEMLIDKFMKKFGVKSREFIEDEITKFLKGEKLTDTDLKILDQKLKDIIKKNEDNYRGINKF